MSHEAVTHEDVEGQTVDLRIYRGDEEDGRYVDYSVPMEPGMVVLDAIHRVQANDAPDLAVRWNCKAGKCGSCSAEINGKPKLMCMTRVDELPDQPIQVAPVKAFPVMKDLVPDVSWNYEVKQEVDGFQPREMTEEEAERGEYKMLQQDIDRVQEFRKCIECFLCQDVCHVLRTHEKHDAFQGPRMLIHYAQMEMNPADEGDRVDELWDEAGIGMCNITKCCTDVCPENINLTDNGIIPMKERVVSRKFDPIAKLWGKITGKA